MKKVFDHLFIFMLKGSNSSMIGVPASMFLLCNMKRSFLSVYPIDAKTLVDPASKSMQEEECKPRVLLRQLTMYAHPRSWYEGDMLVEAGGWNALTVLGVPRLSQWRTASDSCEVDCWCSCLLLLSRYHHALQTVDGANAG